MIKVLGLIEFAIDFNHELRYNNLMARNSFLTLLLLHEMTMPILVQDRWGGRWVKVAEDQWVGSDLTLKTNFEIFKLGVKIPGGLVRA